MRKSLKLFLAMLLIGGSALSFSSCSDKDVNDEKIEIPGDPYLKTSEEGEALRNILGSVAGLDSLPDNWKNSSFTVEPTLGKVLDETNPFVRTIASNSQQEAIDLFKGFTGCKISDGATSQSWSKEGVGSFMLKMTNKDGVFATIDINMPQMPHLTQLRFVDKSLLGENSSKDKPYYHIGDVVKVTENDEVSYWTCVRCCDNAHDKHKTHWISFQLGKNNYKTYDQTDKKAQMIVPTKLGYNSDTERMLKYATEFFGAIVRPDIYMDYAEEGYFSDGLGGLGRLTYTGADVMAISKQWSQKGIFQKVFPQEEIKDWFDYNNIYQNDDSITFYCNGYHYPGSYMRLEYVKVWVENRTETETETGESEWKADTHSFNIGTYVKSGLRQWSGVEKADNPSGRTKDKALVVRYKTGAQLCKKSSSIFTGNDPDPTKPLPEYKPSDPKKRIKIEDAYHYDGVASSDYVFGDMVESSDGSIWTCILSPCPGNDKTIFVTTDNIQIEKNGYSILNKDLPTIDDIYKLYPIMHTEYQDIDNGMIAPVFERLADPSIGAFPIADYMQPINYKGEKTINVRTVGFRTTFAVRSSSGNKQKLLRMYADICTNRAFGCIYKGFTTYHNSSDPLYLSDASDLALIQEKNMTDTMVNNFWPNGKNAPVIRTKAGHDKVASYLYYRKGADMGNGQKSEGGFSDPNDHYSIFNEPVAIIRIRILNSGEDNDFKLIKKSPIEDITKWQNIMAQKLRFFGSNCLTVLDGNEHKVSYSK